MATAYLYEVMMESKPVDTKIYADIEGANVNGGRVPPDIVVTPQRPDMVIVKNTTTTPTVYLVELTCPFTRNITAAIRRKRERYEFLTTDIKDAGYQCINMPFENGSRGHTTRQNKINLT